MHICINYKTPIPKELGCCIQCFFSPLEHKEHITETKHRHRNVLYFQGKYELFLTLMAATCLRKLEQGQQKAEKVVGANQKQMEEHVRTN